MADANYKNDGNSSIQLRGEPDGASVGVTINKQRVEVTGELGTATSWPVAGGTAYVGAGLRGMAGVNHTPNHEAGNMVTGVPTYTDRINARQANAFLNEFDTATGGSYNVRDLSIGNVIALAGRYPAVLRPSQQRRVGQVDEAIARVETQIGEVQQRLASFLESGDAQRLPAEQRAQLQNLVQPPFNRANIDRTTVGQVGDVFGRASQAIDRAGGAAGIAERISNDLPSSVHDADDRQRLAASLGRVEEEVDRIADRAKNPPDPNDLKRDHKLLRQVVSYEPAVELSAYVAGAFATPKVVPGLQTVAAAAYELGGRVDIDNLWAKRTGPEGRKVNLRVEPSIISSSVASVGIGTNVPTAMPEDVARALLIRDSGTGLNAGVYVAVRESTEKMMGVTLENRKDVELGARVTQGLGNGNYGYVEAVVVEPIKPSTGGTKAAVSIGRTF